MWEVQVIVVVVVVVVVVHQHELPHSQDPTVLNTDREPSVDPFAVFCFLCVLKVNSK